VVAGYDQNPEGHAVVEGQTTATGRFSVPTPDARAGPGTYFQVLALQAGWAPGFVQVQWGYVLTVRLEANPATWSGIVSTPEGQPVAGAQVLVTQLRAPPERGDRFFPVVPAGATAGPLQATTGPDGRFSVSGLPAAGSVGYTVRAAGRAPVVGHQAPVQGETAVTLLRGASVSGKVSAGDKPAAGVTVRATPLFGSGLPAQAVTGEDGTYTIGGLAEGPTAMRVVDPPEGMVSSIRSGVNMRTGETTTGADLALTPGAVLSGKIVETEGGRPIAGLTVKADWRPSGPEMMTQGLDQPAGSAVTAADGTYRLRVPPGRILLVPSRRSPGGPGIYGLVADQRSFEVAEGETKNGLDIMLKPPARLRGRVLRPDGNPAARVDVSAAGYYSFGYGAFLPAPVQTDTQGRFTLEFNKDQRAGALACTVIAQDNATGQVGIGLIKEAQAPADIRLALGVYLEGEVRDAQDRPQSDVGVMVKMAGAPGNLLDFPGGSSDERGKLRIGPLPTGATVWLELCDEQRRYALPGTWTGLGPFVLGEKAVTPLPVLRVDLRGGN
jgi:hypothetical protein